MDSPAEAPSHHASKGQCERNVQDGVSSADILYEIDDSSTRLLQGHNEMPSLSSSPAPPAIDWSDAKWIQSENTWITHVHSISSGTASATSSSLFSLTTRPSRRIWNRLGSEFLTSLSPIHHVSSGIVWATISSLLSLTNLSRMESRPATV